MKKTTVVGASVTLVLVATALAACSPGGDDAGGKTEITLSGPNQWNTSGSSFGPEWEALIDAFEKDNPDITVKTNVLPLTSFYDTLSTQLASGTASELVFNQAAYEPYMVHQLDDDLQKPNPFVEGNDKWIDVFDPKVFGFDAPYATDAEGHLNIIPFNLYAPGLIINTEIFDEVGVTAPIDTFAELMDACTAFTAAGYTPVAVDNSSVTLDGVVGTILNMLTYDDFDSLNAYDTAGDPGTAPQLTQKSWAKAILSGEISGSTPAVVETQKLLKEFYDTCATPNWSGITNNSGAIAGAQEFSAGKAAMAWGNSAAGLALADTGLDLATMAFPTITSESSALATGAPAEFGKTLGGTSYMIPANVEGDKLAAAITFLQYVSAPEKIGPWLEATKAVPAIEGATVPEFVAGLVDGDWGTLRRMTINMPVAPAGQSSTALFDGFLLGEKTLEEQQQNLTEQWTTIADEWVDNNDWSSEPWAQN